MRKYNNQFLARQEIQQEISKIPKKNRAKFFCDYMRLVQYAQKDNYDNFDF